MGATPTIRAIALTARARLRRETDDLLGTLLVPQRASGKSAGWRLPPSARVRRWGCKLRYRELWIAGMIGREMLKSVPGCSSRPYLHPDDDNFAILNPANCNLWNADKSDGRKCHGRGDLVGKASRSCAGLSGRLRLRQTRQRHTNHTTRFGQIDQRGPPIRRDSASVFPVADEGQVLAQRLSDDGCAA